MMRVISFAHTHSKLRLANDTVMQHSRNTVSKPQVTRYCLGNDAKQTTNALVYVDKASELK